uniref:Uncharacterized protein n=1 Tax=uncultured marine microorganism HF4000_009L19 TaxID=455516 RepID=B3T1E7_9ZZZZ|nr:hypothetical protein ALOHA_HF4000009L19ctg1g3 [uncultured marine microorganism HF4000_009L19]
MSCHDYVIRACEFRGVVSTDKLAKRSSVLLSPVSSGIISEPFQREQVGEHVGQFLFVERVGGGRHRRGGQHGVLAQLSLHERPQAFLPVNQLHRVGILVQPAAVDDGAVACHRANGPVHGEHRAGRVEQRTLQRRGGADGTDVAQVRCGARAIAIHAMTGRAGTLRSEQAASTGDVTQMHRAHVEVAHGPEEGDQAGQLGRGEVVRWHRRAGDAGSEQPHQLEVRPCPTVLPA